MVSQMVPYLPCYDGFRLIPAHLIRELSKRHEIYLTALSNETGNADKLEWPRRYCRSVEILQVGPSQGLLDRLVRLSRPLPQKLVEAVRAQIKKIQPDILHLEGPRLAPLAQLASPGVTTLLSAHDALSLRYCEFAKFAQSRWSRAVYTARSLAARWFERRWYRKVDRVVITSTADLEALSRSVPRGRLAVIPNGVDLEHWAYRFAPQPGRVIFTGNMNWPPNEDAAEYFAVNVFPLVRKENPDAEFWIVGAEPSPNVKALAEISGVHVTGTVPDLREWICSAEVYVSPLRFGEGVKNKILEAMALGTPIVATPKSLTGTPLSHGHHLLVAEKPPEMGQAVLRLLHDDGLCQTLSKDARRHVENDYRWESIAVRFEKLYQKSYAVSRGEAAG